MGWFVHRLELLPVVEPTLCLTDPNRDQALNNSSLFPAPFYLVVSLSLWPCSVAQQVTVSLTCVAVRAFTYTFFPPMFLPPLSSLAS